MARSRAVGRVWMAAVAVGVAGGVLTLVFPTLGWFVVLLFVVPVVVVGPRLAGFGGLLMGVGLTWLTLLVRSSLACRAFDAEPGRECIQSDLAPWLVTGGIMLASGMALSVATVVLSRRRP